MADGCYLTRLRDVLAQDFSIDPEAVVPDARLDEDLDLDSIDAADLVVRLKEVTGKSVRPNAFRSARTVGDVLDVLDSL
ncbi:MAG: acyl carrier protein [Burkholderiales bacterium]